MRLHEDFPKDQQDILVNTYNKHKALGKKHLIVCLTKDKCCLYVAPNETEKFEEICTMIKGWKHDKNMRFARILMILDLNKDLPPP